MVPLADGWKVMVTGQIAAPISLTTRIAEAVYDKEWRPRSLFIDGSVKDQPTTVKTAFDGGKAVSEVVQGGQTFHKADAVSDRTIVLPNLIFGLYEALAARLVDGGARHEVSRLRRAAGRRSTARSRVRCRSVCPHRAGSSRPGGTG